MRERAVIVAHRLLGCDAHGALQRDQHRVAEHSRHERAQDQHEKRKPEVFDSQHVVDKEQDASRPGPHHQQVRPPLGFSRPDLLDQFRGVRLALRFRPLGPGRAGLSGFHPGRSGGNRHDGSRRLIAGRRAFHQIEDVARARACAGRGARLLWGPCLLADGILAEQEIGRGNLGIRLRPRAAACVVVSHGSLGYPVVAATGVKRCIFPSSLAAPHGGNPLAQIDLAVMPNCNRCRRKMRRSTARPHPSARGGPTPVGPSIITETRRRLPTRGP